MVSGKGAAGLRLGDELLDSLQQQARPPSLPWCTYRFPFHYTPLWSPEVRHNLEGPGLMLVRPPETDLRQGPPTSDTFVSGCGPNHT